MIAAKKLMMVGLPLDPDARAFIDRMSVKPGRARQKLISDTIKALKDAAVWQTLDALYLFAAHSAQASLLNAVQPTYNATISGTMTFQADSGIVGSAGAANFLNTNLSLNAEGLKIAASSASVAVCLSVGRVSVDNDAFLTGANSQMEFDDSGTRYVLFRNDGFVTAANARTGTSVEHVTRLNAITTAFRNGQQVGTSSLAVTTGPGTTPFLIGGNRRQDATQRAAAIGSHLTASQAASLNSIIRNYLTSIGAAS